ncbi:MAG: hypothetical protein LBT79_02630 [Elusimicrobiota bacterium]|jgi:hypothetical protein|nr:hypothetical protein [Elusimicrobiota bacterium]
MPNNKPDYENIINAKWKENANQVPDLVKKGEENTLKQIKTYSHRFDEPVKKVKEKILGDLMFANCFAKDPGRQTLHEKIAYDYLKKYDEILKNFCKLSQGGKDAVYLTNDGLFQSFSQTHKKIGKALDFFWENGGKKFYASHKYTKDSGGAQDSQFNEQESLLRKFKGNTNNNEFLFIICDGAYYTKDKFKQLKSLESKRSFVVCIEAVVNKVKVMLEK